MRALFDNPVLDEEKEEVIVKKIIGAMVMFMGCVMAAIDLERMIIGLEYGWGGILGGFVISVLSWLFLLDSNQGLLLNAAKSAVCIVALVCGFLFVDAGNRTEPITVTDNVRSIPDTSQSTEKDKTYADDNICDYCGGSGMCDYCILGQCDHCFGEGEIWCESCLGSGSCQSCYGMGGELRYMVGSDNQWVTCSRCGGGGMCSRCNGMGATTCNYCHGSGSCAYCNGAGDCAYCHGTGTK